MATRNRTPPDIRGRRPEPLAVPFFLALGRPGGMPAATAVRLRRLQASLAGELQRLDAACWLGKLDARELERLQELRSAFAQANRAVDPREPGAPG